MTPQEYKQLQPSILINEDGTYLAPQTTTEVVYGPDGRTVEELLEEAKTSTNEILSTKVQIVEATFNGQCIFNLKYPIVNYDIEKFPIVVVARNKLLSPTEYKINVNYPNDDQLLIDTEKVDAFTKGETLIVIYHYSNTIYSGNTINANTINNTYVTIGAPPTDGTELPDPSVFFDFVNNQIIYYANGKKTVFPIGAKDILRSYKTITSTTQILHIDIDGYKKEEDTLLVYENSVLLIEGVDYIIDDNLNMSKPNNVVWLATTYEPITFEFFIYKKSKGIIVDNNITDTPSSGSGDVASGSIGMDKLTYELQTTIKNLKDKVAMLEKQIEIQKE